MKIALLSDLHLSVQPMEVPYTDADVVVLAGDLQRPAQAMSWARQFDKPTVFVAGNHEFYGSDLVTTMAQLRTHAQGSQVRVLEHGEWHHDGVRFLGCTLWSDYRLFTSPEQREQGLHKAQEFVRDFSRIGLAPDFPERFTPAVSQMLFDTSVAWLEARFAEPFDGPTVVVTHFAPARGSIASQFVGSPLNACFVSDLEAHILRWQPRLWLHGHVHDGFDYHVGATRIVANPRGYAPQGVVENKTFAPELVLEI
ncbi:metallophosphoesterase [Candidatus Aalborgicola defluviihabitans]|uniref:metallophosphoesterase n=1 Tax=Candidatus Aalborgicola defluviihabitans TaxID=3386187 RepID=UPI001E0A20A8|nr:metallophosphoesterase family protein [Burkholderiales bacterium]MBK6567301.1 metallophosphoesterase family protein [Burkholderiales bacterium]MBK7314622.1 metallophosphoesterase family protein [Burkholderiales bacterium]